MAESESMKFNEATGTYEAEHREKKVPLRERIKGKLSSIQESHREERQFKQSVKAEAKTAEREGYRKGYITGRQKRGFQKGVAEGQKQFGGGFAGRLEGAARFAQKHVEVGGRESDFGMGGGKAHDLGLGFRAPKESDLGLGFGAPSRKKGKKRDTYSEFGL